MDRADTIRTLPTPADVADAGAAALVERLGRAITQRGKASVVLSGGGTPKAVYERLATVHARAIDWSRVTVYFGDERAVEPSHPDSNFRMVDSAMLTRLTFAAVHRIPGELGAPAAAAAYERLVPDAFDVCLLGMGADGHTASLFAPLTHWPGLVAATIAPPPFAVTDRISLTPQAFARAGSALAFITGADKQSMLRRVLAEREADGPRTLPMSFVRPRGIDFILDQAATIPTVCAS